MALGVRGFGNRPVDWDIGDAETATQTRIITDGRREEISRKIQDEETQTAETLLDEDPYVEECGNLEDETPHAQIALENEELVVSVAIVAKEAPSSLGRSISYKALRRFVGHYSQAWLRTKLSSSVSGCY